MWRNAVRTILRSMATAADNSATPRIVNDLAKNPAKNPTVRPGTMQAADAHANLAGRHMWAAYRHFIAAFRHACEGISDAAVASNQHVGYRMDQIEHHIMRRSATRVVYGNILRAMGVCMKKISTSGMRTSVALSTDIDDSESKGQVRIATALRMAVSGIDQVVHRIVGATNRIEGKAHRILALPAKASLNAVVENKPNAVRLPVGTLPPSRSMHTVTRRYHHNVAAEHDKPITHEDLKKFQDEFDQIVKKIRDALNELRDAEKTNK